MRNFLLTMVGAVGIGLAASAGAQTLVTEWLENFEDDALGALPSAYAPGYWGNDSRVVASGTDGIASPDGSAQYAMFVGPKVTPGASSYWFNDPGTNPPVLALDNNLSADFYIDPSQPYSADVYLASTFWVNQAYNGEIGLGYTLLNDGGTQVVFHVSRFGLGHKGSARKTVAKGWYHLEMAWADADGDGKVDVTCTITDTNGNLIYSWWEPTEFAAGAVYTTAGFQIRAGENGFVPLRVDNLRAKSWPSDGLPVADVKANGSDTPIVVTVKDKVVLDVSLYARAYVGVPVDWWLLADTPTGWYHYNPLTDRWIPGFVRSWGGDLDDIPPTIVYTDILTAPGLYRVYFGVDYAMNGVLDPSMLIYDTVDVTVTP